MALAVLPPPPAEPVVRGSRGTVYAVSSFGVDGTTFGPSFRAGEHFESERYRTLDFKQQYPLGRRGDDRLYDFKGRPRQAGSYALFGQPLIGSSVPTDYVSLDARRPSHPYRLARVVTRAFTALVFGDHRFPKLSSDDPDTADFAEAVAKQAELASRFAQARNVGGGQGSCLVSWSIHEGKLRVRVHGGKTIVHHEWIDRDALELAHCSKLTRVQRREWSEREKKVVNRWYVQRRDWTPTADVLFREVDEADPEPSWVVDEEQTVFHGDGFPHCVWIRNGSADDDDEVGVDGECDVESQWEDLDGIDVLCSVLDSGTVRNLDPTLLLKLSDSDAQKARSGGVKKGSNQSITTSPDGDAKYLELSGTSTTAGLALFESERSRILEVAQCVVPSADQMSAAGMSSVAQKMLFAPMLGQANAHRLAYGAPLVRLVEQVLESCRRRMPDLVDGELVYPVEVDEEGEEREVAYELDLPPKVVVDPETNERRSVARRPGKGRISLAWPDYFEKTAADLESKGRAVASAAGGKAVLSQRTAVEIMASEFGRDPEAEWERVQAEAKAALEAEQGVVGGSLTDAAGSGAVSFGGVEGAGGKGAAQVAAAKLRAQAEVLPQVATVNEIRAQHGLGPLVLPDGTPDPRGEVPLPQFLALLDAAGQAAGAAAPAPVLRGDPSPEAAIPAPGDESPGKAPPGAGNKPPPAPLSSPA